jgi:hypothetical protein
MGGSDRGGIPELIKVIKNSKVLIPPSQNLLMFYVLIILFLA